MPTLTVAIPVYNAVVTIDAALASVAAQTMKPDEVLIVDDGSSDGTLDAIGQWADRLPVRVVEHSTNRGVSAARSTLLGATATELCATLDADDYWLPTHLKTLHALWLQDGGLITANALFWDPRSGTIGPEYRAVVRVPPSHRQQRVIVRRNFVFTGTLFSVADARDAGGYRVECRAAEDWDLWIRMVRRGVVVRPADEPTLLYRVSPAGLTMSGEVAEAASQVLQWAASESSTRAQRRQARIGLGLRTLSRSGRRALGWAHGRS